MVKNKKEMPQAEGVTLLHLHPLVKREENAIIKFFLSLSLFFLRREMSQSVTSPPTLLPHVFSQPISVCQSIESCLGCHWMRYTRRGHCVCEVQQRAEPCSCPSLFTPSLHTQVGNVELFGAAAGRFLFFSPLGEPNKNPRKNPLHSRKNL